MPNPYSGHYYKFNFYNLLFLKWYLNWFLIIKSTTLSYMFFVNIPTYMIWRHKYRYSRGTTFTHWSWKETLVPLLPCLHKEARPNSFRLKVDAVLPWVADASWIHPESTNSVHQQPINAELRHSFPTGTRMQWEGWENTTVTGSLATGWAKTSC